MALLNFTNGIRLTKSIISSRGEWAQQQYVLPSTYKGGDAEFVVTKQLLEICPRGNNKRVIIIFPCS